MSILEAVAGDIGDSRDILLRGVSSLAPVSSVEAHVWRRDVTPVTLTATLDVATLIATVQFGGVGGWLAGALPGKWNFEIQINFTGGNKLTWPEGDPDEIHVRAQGA